jgi:hypothetical protein
MLAAGIAVGLILSVVAIVMALVALSAARGRRSADPEERVAALEDRVRGLAYRVWQAPFAERKLAPLFAHNEVSRARRPRRLPGPAGGARAALRRRPRRAGLGRRARLLPSRRGLDLASARRALGHGSASPPSRSASPCSQMGLDTALLATRVALGLVAGP